MHSTPAPAPCRPWSHPPLRPERMRAVETALRFALGLEDDR